jgi:RND family efflux transporter MFP subunit
MRIERRHIVPLIIGTAVVLVLGFGAIMLRRAEARVNKVALASSAKPVTVIEAKQSSFRASRRYVATLAPWLEARVGPQLVSAYVDTVLVRPGALVNKGEVLATLDCRNANASSQAVAMQARALDARTQALAHEVSRVQGLADGGFVSANDLEQRAAQSAAEEAQLLAAKAKLLGTSLEVNDCILRAPFEGEVATRIMDPGAFARPGGAIVTVVDRKIVRLTADVPEGDFEVVRPESPVRIHLLSTGKDLSGKISRRSPAADVSTRTVHFEVDLLDPSRSMPVGTTAEVAIDVGEPLPATEIPLSAAKVRGSKATLFIVDHDVATSAVFETLGESGGSLYLKTDLKPGTHVVTEGRSVLSNNDRVAAKLEPFEVRKSTTTTPKAPDQTQAAASTGVAKESTSQ